MDSHDVVWLTAAARDSVACTISKRTASGPGVPDHYDNLPSLDHDLIHAYGGLVFFVPRQGRGSRNRNSKLYLEKDEVTDTNPSSATIYRELDDSDSIVTATRLVKILPDLSHDGKVRCTLEAASLYLFPIVSAMKGECGEPNVWKKEAIQKVRDYATTHYGASPEQPVYRTLSYLWGEEAGMRDILVNGVECSIRPNLWQFLNHVRQIPKLIDDYWWIDALCIDQSNTLEKNQQVARMGLIYLYAASTTIWLGTALQRFDCLLDIAKEFDDQFGQESPRDNSPRLRWVLEEIFHQHAWSLRDYYLHSQELYGLSYWRRAWVQQELSLGNELHVLTGSRLIPFRMLARLDAAVSMIDETHMSESIAEGCWTHSFHLLTIMVRAEFDRGEVMHQFTSIATFSNNSELDCTDPRDIIYSHLAMVINGFRFPVNYSESNLVLLLRTCLFCLDRQRSFDMDEVCKIAFGLKVNFYDLCKLHETTVDAVSDRYDLLFRCESRFYELFALPESCVKGKVNEEAWRRRLDAAFVESEDDTKIFGSPCSSCAVVIVEIHCPVCDKLIEILPDSRVSRFICVNGPRSPKFHLLFSLEGALVADLKIHIIFDSCAGVSEQFGPSMPTDAGGHIVHLSLATMLFVVWLHQVQLRSEWLGSDPEGVAAAITSQEQVCSHRLPCRIFERKITPPPETEAERVALLESIQSWPKGSYSPRLIEYITKKSLEQPRRGALRAAKRQKTAHTA